MARCPCSSGLSYADCCGRFHTGTAVPATAEALMRSRYVAYGLKLSSYLIDSWHSSTCPANLDLTGDRTAWQRLEIIAKEQGMEADEQGWVEFVAHYQGGQLHERSHFVKEAGRWFYVDGEMLPPVPTAKPGRNDSCPCGSGKKYKKCCG